MSGSCRLILTGATPSSRITASFLEASKRSLAAGRQFHSVSSLPQSSTPLHSFNYLRLGAFAQFSSSVLLCIPCTPMSSKLSQKSLSSSSFPTSPHPFPAPSSSPFSIGLQSLPSDLQESFSELLEDYLCPLLVPVHWGDQDPLGHVNNTVYARWAETARIHSMREIFFASQFTDSERISVANYISLSPSMKSIGPIIKSLNIKYKFPVIYPDNVLIGSRLSQIELDRFTLDHRILSITHRRIVCECSAVIVSYHYGTLKKAEKTPQEVQNALFKWQKVQEKKLDELRSAATHLEAERTE